MIMRINEVIPLSDYTLKIVFDEGLNGIFNVKPYLKYSITSYFFVFFAKVF